MPRALFAILATLLLGCEPAQPPTPKAQPPDAARGDAARDHVWQGQVQALDKARAVADQAGQIPAARGEAVEGQ